MHGGGAAFEIWEKLIPFQTLQRPLYVILGEKKKKATPSFFATPDPTSAYPLPTSLKQDTPVQAYSAHHHFGPCFSEGPSLLKKTNSEIITACCFVSWSGLLF